MPSLQFPTDKSPAKRQFGDFAIDCLSRQDLVAMCEADLQSDHRQARLVFDVNGHGLSLAKSCPAYRNAIQKADIVHADGGFLVTLSRYLPGPTIPERSATTDMIHDFAAQFSRTGKSFFLLGGDEETNKATANRLRQLYPGLRIVGRHHGYFNDGEESKIIAMIKRSMADVVWVGLGKPKEQSFSCQLRDHLSKGWIITCGGCFNYITGSYKRAPSWMRKANLEWLHRLILNPRQLFWRYASTNPHALWIALTSVSVQTITPARVAVLTQPRTELFVHSSALGTAKSPDYEELDVAS